MYSHQVLLNRVVSIERDKSLRIPLVQDNHPGDFDEYSESISEQFLEWNSFSQTASRYTFYSELGVIAVVERGFYMSHFDESLLSLFKIELTLLAHSNNCTSNGD